MPYLHTPIEALSGVGPTRKAAYNRMGVYTVEDLLYHFPRAYEHRGDIRALAGKAYPVIRIMPNTPVSVGSGVILYDATENVAAGELALFCRCMERAGLLDRLEEKLMDAGTAVAGCGPAFACLFLEALADGGVVCGLPREKALRYAAHMLEGTAKLLLETGKHPGVLKDAVCSPGGSTIAGVRALEEGSFRAAAISAVEAAYSRTKALGK